MIDYIKIQVSNVDVNRLLALDYLDFKTVVSRSTSLVSDKDVAEFHFCKITVRKNEYVQFSGSIHKFYNSINSTIAPNYKKESYKGFNGNQYNLNQLLETIKILETIFNVTANNMTLRNVEFGLNLDLAFNPKLFLKGLLYHNGKAFQFDFNENYAQAKHNNHIVKIYNKSLQYGMPDKTLRFELKFLRMVDVNKAGIYNLADINIVTMDNVKTMLLRRLDEVVYYDYTIIKKDFSNLTKSLLKDYSRKNYWLYDLSANHRHRHKQRLQKIITNNSENLRLQIKNEIIEKCVIINRIVKAPNCVIINHSIIGQNITQSNPKITARFCVVTGLDISMQKSNSIMLSHTGLRHYFKHNNKAYQILKKRYLTNTWIGCDFDTEIIKIAHSIRDRNRNRSKTKD